MRGRYDAPVRNTQPHTKRAYSTAIPSRSKTWIANVRKWDRATINSCVQGRGKNVCTTGLENDLTCLRLVAKRPAEMPSCLPQ